MIFIFTGNTSKGNQIGWRISQQLVFALNLMSSKWKVHFIVTKTAEIITTSTEKWIKFALLLIQILNKLFWKAKAFDENLQALILTEMVWLKTLVKLYDFQLALMFSKAFYSGTGKKIIKRLRNFEFYFTATASNETSSCCHLLSLMCMFCFVKQLFIFPCPSFHRQKENNLKQV